LAAGLALVFTAMMWIGCGLERGCPDAGHEGKSQDG